MIRLAVFALLILLGLPGGHEVRAADTADACRSTSGTGIWTSPRHPKAGEPLRIMAVSTARPLDSLVMFDAENQPVDLETKARGGPPWSLSATTDALGRGDYRIRAGGSGENGACLLVSIGAGDHPASDESGWNLALEGLYAAWIEQLFDAPVDENLSFPSLEPVLRAPGRNFLHDYLGLGEDKGLPATPDCADLPYFLRAYFAWKMALPIAYRACNRGSSRAPPRCGSATVRDEFTRGTVTGAGFRALSRQLVDVVHSGSARTALNDEATDYYPVELSRQTLWPGTVYADPYGHVLVLTQWLPQTSGRPGLLLAVDAQPDNSVNRKRFWEGTFLFANPIAQCRPRVQGIPSLVARARREFPASGQWRTHGPRRRIAHFAGTAGTEPRRVLCRHGCTH